MKLSENTINILKNFATINPSLLVHPGDILTTMSPVKSILAKANVEETFPKQFAIFEMSKFLGVLSLFKEPDLDFSDRQVKIASGRQSVNYTYADPSMIIAPDPNKDINFPAADIEFSISQEELQRVVRASGVLQLPEIAVTGDGTNILVTATNSKNPTADVFSIEVGNSDKTFNMIFKVENIIKLISGNYNVMISSKGLSKWTTDKITYYVATEANSSFGN
jgi:gp45 sliding clamp, C terminal